MWTIMFLFYSSVSPFCISANSPLQIVDVDGDRLVDANGNRIKFKIDSKGTITYTKNGDKLSDEMKSYLSILASTEIGKNSLRKLNRNMRRVVLSVKKDRVLFSVAEIRKTFRGYEKLTQDAIENGRITEEQAKDPNYKIVQWGENHSFELPDGDFVREAVVYEGSIDAIEKGQANPSPYSDSLENHTKEEKIAITLLHEFTEALNPRQSEKKSRRLEKKLSKQLTEKEVDKK